MSNSVFIDCFSGSLADMKRGTRTHENALRVLAKDGRVSCFDRSGPRWIDMLLNDLLSLGLVEEEKNVPYPWCRFYLTAKGNDFLAELNGVKG